MSLFRRLGRQFERYRQLAKQARSDASITRCEGCGALMVASQDRCLTCGAQAPHAVLDVTPDASDAVVKAAAREKIKEAHPDQGGSQLQFRRVKQARDRLLD